MDLIQLVYASQPFGFDEASLRGNLMDARRCNARDGVTGTLLCRSDVYLQMLEGPERVVAGTYARIVKDDRHMDPVLLRRAPASERLFANWAMRHDPASTVIWSPEEVAAGRRAALAPDDLRDVFARLAAGAADDA